MRNPKVVKETTNGCSVKVEVARGRFKQRESFHLLVADVNVGALKGIASIGEDLSYKESVSAVGLNPAWLEKWPLGSL